VSVTATYTIAYSCDEGTFDLCKVIIGGDGSYYVTAPYHPQNRAVLGIFTVNYAHPPTGLLLNRAVELATLDDDDKRLKLSHHPDGFIQFSGTGITSGIGPDGTIRGIGVRSWPLEQPTLGPSFRLIFSDPTETGRPSRNRPGTIIFSEEDLVHMRKNTKGLTITGFYLPVRWREYVRRIGADNYQLGLVNPDAQAVLPLRVALASVDSRIPGMIGFRTEPHHVDTENGTPSIMLSSSSGNLRRNRQRELVGDQLVCIYPRPAAGLPAGLPSLNRPLNAPAYVLPPWHVRAAVRLAQRWRRRRRVRP
jgi:hypothetical protein